LSKSKKHYIGIVWDEGGKKAGIALQAGIDTIPLLAFRLIDRCGQSGAP
jgi:hypothetical protein